MLASPLTEAEQNRLIQDHMEMVAKIASDYRGQKGIPFEDLEGEGMKALVQAARIWEGRAKFSTFATSYIRGYIKNFIKAWEDLESLDESDDRDDDRVHEWDIWGTFPAEGWKTLPATPEDILDIYQTIADRTASLQAAFLSLTPRERKMIRAHFLDAPKVGIQQIARDFGVSYYRAVEIIYDAVKKLRDIVSKIEQNKSSPRHASNRVADKRHPPESPGLAAGGR